MFNLSGYGHILLDGSITTIELSLLSLLISFLLGLIGASAKLSKNRIGKILGTAYTTLIRAVPDLVLMLLIYYSLQIWINDLTDWLNSIQNSIDFEWNLNPFTSGAITLGFIYGAYFTETFRGAFLAVPKGQLEAARAYGMRPFLTFRRILFPQMMRYALPGLANNWQVILKATALVSIIGLSDVVDAATHAGEATFRSFYFYCVAGFVYLVLTSVSNLVLMLLERKYMIGVRQAAL